MLASIVHTFDAVIKPDLTSTTTRSAAATIGHMLRVVIRRIDDEGQMHYDERSRLNDLLPRVAEHLQAHGRPVSPAIAARPALDPAIYPAPAIMAAEVGALRQGVCDALEQFQGGQRDSHGDALYTELTDYIAWQLARESEIFEAACMGLGPRR